MHVILLVYAVISLVILGHALPVCSCLPTFVLIVTAPESDMIPFVCMACEKRS